MKFIKLLSLPAVSVLSLTVRGDKVIEVPKFHFNDVFYDLSSYDTLDFRVIDVATTEQFVINLRGYLASNDQLLFDKQSRITSRRREAPFSIDLYSYLTSSGLKLEFTFSHINEPNETRTITLFPNYQSQTIHANLQKDKAVTIDNVCFGMVSNRLFKSESLDFTNLNEYFTKNNGGQIDISEVHFEYSVSNAFRYGNAYLEITDYQNLFPHIGGSLLKLIPISIMQQSHLISFSINSGMYVNNVTHDMSDTPIDGYVETDYFYIPMNKEKDFIKNDFRIVINDAGFSHSEIYIPLIFYNDSQSLGFCYDSDFCISGGIRE